MPECFNLCLGGIPISLIPNSHWTGYDFVKRASDFQTSTAPEINLHIHCGDFPEFSESQIVFNTHQGWYLLHADGRLVIRVYSANQDPYQLGVFPPDFRGGDIYVAQSEDDPDRYVFPLSYPMGELFMMNLLGTGLGMLFHAAGVIHQGKAYLFTGHGGAGKTTTARLWEKTPGVRVVNDDKVILRKEGDGFRLYGTPWHGQGGMALPDSAPLARVFILKQAAQNYVTPIHPVQAAANLLARTFVPLWDAEKIDFSLKFLDELCQSVPCHELGFLPDSSAVDFVLNLS